MSATEMQVGGKQINSANYSTQRFGPTLDLGCVHFQLWAPSAGFVRLLIEGDAALTMVRSQEGFWSARCRATFGTRYRFDVDGLLIPDPASRFQPLDVHGPSELVDPCAYEWKNTRWEGRPWEQTILYEIHPGIAGGFKGVMNRLYALKDLGVTAIELMPIADFAGNRNWGYDGVLPFAPDSAYGTPDELRALVDEAHGLGLMVFLDVVYNHFGPDGNFLPSYAPEFFAAETHTPWGPAIDFAKPVIRRYFTENALYWLEQFRIDGLRLDAVHAIQQRDWLPELASEIRARITSRHVHLVLENEDNDAELLESGFDGQWNDDFHNVMHVLLTEESHSYYKDFVDRPIHRLARCLSQGFIYQGDASSNRNGAPRGKPSSHLPPTSFVTFLQNHDQIGNRAFGERLTALAPKPALKAAAALLLLSPQIPLLFMGEEFGATAPFLFFTDFDGDLAKVVREGRRREFLGAPGFGSASSYQQIPDPNSMTTFEASRFDDSGSDPIEWRDWIQSLLAVRHRHIIPYLAAASNAGASVVGQKAVVASWRLANDAIMVIACNLAPAAVAADLPIGTPLFGARPEPGQLPPLSTLMWITT